ncbi:MAG: glycosyltransferase family 4 protein [Desulfococcaceae bacterium]
MKPVLGMVLKGYPRISETFISNEILRLEALGLRIHIISMRRPREDFSHASIREIRAGVDYLPENLLPELGRLLPANLRTAARYPAGYRSALGLAARRLARTRKSATLKHLFQAGYLVDRVLPGKNIVHLHAHFAHSPTSVTLFAARIAGLPFSFTGHAKDIYTSNRRQLREKIDLAKFVVTCTEYNRRYLAELAAESGQCRPDSGRPTPVHRVYHGIDLRLFDGNGTEKPPPKPPYRLMTVARIVPKKGLPTVYDALRRLRDRGVEFRHTLIGDGDDRDEILRIIRKLKMDDWCQWAGALPHEKVLDHYRRSDLFVLGCRVAKNGDRDGIPNVLVEAMAMNLPVVATNISAIPELVVRGRTGLLVPPENPEALADAVVRLLTDAALRERVVPAARERVRERFDNRRLIRDLAEIYRREQPLLA